MDLVYTQSYTYQGTSLVGEPVQDNAQQLYLLVISILFSNSLKLLVYLMDFSDGVKKTIEIITGNKTIIIAATP